MDKIKISRAIVAALMLWLAVQPIAHGQNLEEQLTDYFYDFFQSEAGQTAVLSNLRAPAEQQDVYRSHLARIFSERALLREMAHSALSLTQSMQPKDFKELAPIMAEVGFGIAQRAVQQGIRRLPPDDIRLLLAHEAFMLEQISPERCIGLIENRLSAAEATDLAMAYQKTLSREDLRQYLDLTARALLAHFRDSPLPKTISPSQGRIAAEQFERALGQHPHFDLIARISLRPSAYSAAENCWMSVQSLWVAIEQEGIIGDWLMILFAEQI